MFKQMVLAKGNKDFPHRATSILFIDTRRWAIPFLISHYEDVRAYTEEVCIVFLCFTLCFRKFYKY